MPTSPGSATLAVRHSTTLSTSASFSLLLVLALTCSCALGLPSVRVRQRRQDADTATPNTSNETTTSKLTPESTTLPERLEVFEERDEYKGQRWTVAPRLQSNTHRSNHTNNRRWLGSELFSLNDEHCRLHAKPEKRSICPGEKDKKVLVTKCKGKCYGVLNLRAMPTPRGGAKMVKYSDFFKPVCRCCRPTKTYKVDVEITCENGDVKTVKMEHAMGCACTYGC